MRRTAAAAVLLAALAGCDQPTPVVVVDAEPAPRAVSRPDAILPVSDDFPSQAPGVRPPIDTDEGGLWMRVDNIEREIRTAGNRVRDPALHDYVHGIVCKLAGPWCPDIRTYVLRVPAFNASMAPTGLMQVWTGLLLRCRDEAQLAAILGHEIGHYVRRHSIQLWRDARSKTDFLVFFQIALAAARIPFAGDAVSYGLIGSIYMFSRDAEREADRIGLALMSRAGYDPHAVPAIWRQLIREDDADKDKGPRMYYFATHPTASERLRTLDRMADAVQGAKDDRGVDRYRAMIAPYRMDWIRDELALRRFDRLEALLDLLAEDGANPGETAYARGELFRLRDKEGDADKALAALQGAAAAAGAPPEALRSLGLVQLRRGDRAAARDAFAGYLRRQPEAGDRAMIEALIAAPG